MNTTTAKRLLLPTVLAFALILTWANNSYADLTITNAAPPPEDKKQGYIDNSTVTFAVTSGQAQTATKPTVSRAMRRVELAVNDKSIVVQNSGDKELYVKGQSPSGAITVLSEQDYKVIQQAEKSLTQLKPGNTADELHEAVGTALSLLSAWPRNMPLLIWQDGKQKIYAIDSASVFNELLTAKSSEKSRQAKSVDKAILDRPDALQLPEIQPLQPLPLLEVEPKAGASAANINEKADGAPDSDSSRSLCNKMGVRVQGSYPLIESTFSFPFTEVVGTDTYKAKVGGEQCLSRCGGGCVDSVTGANGFGKNAYSQDCLDHDICVGRRGNGAFCNFIFSDAANDFFATPCSHDLFLQNIVVSNDKSATSQASDLSSQENLFVIFTVKNNGKTKLPHNKIFFDISVDGEKKSTRQLAKVLNGSEAARYFYRIGNAKDYAPGKHRVSIQINAKNLIETKIENNFVRKSFTLIRGS